MRKQENIRFILENAESLNDKDWTTIQRICRKIEAKKQADSEKNEFLEDLMHTNSLHIRKKIELVELQELLSTYFNEKGMQSSLFHLNDLLSIISSDIRTIDNHMADNKESIHEVRKLLVANEKGKEDTL